VNDSEEAALVRRCQTGDKEAFRALIEPYRAALFGTAYLMTRNRGQAEDAVQESLVQIWKNLPSLRLHGRLKSWLLRIVVNEVKQQFRKKQVPTVPLKYASDIVDCPGEDEMAMARREERQLLRQALGKLPSEQSETVILRYFSGLTVPEMSVVMGIREGTIKSRLSRALERLGQMLRDEELSGGEI
jgi:RNA polymerase sigma-70 factor (ECF subfamily)